MSRRRELGLTRDELAQRANCAPITVEKVERGERRPSEQVARFLLSALDVPVHQHEVLLGFAKGEIKAEELQRALGASRPQPAGLPVLLTQFLGRERELADAVALLLQPDVRLLTLTGPGGVGKTRLALRVAQEIAHAFPGALYLVPLAPIYDPDLVVSTIAQAVGLKDGGETTPIEGLKRELRNRRALLVVDNFEQVILAAPVLSELLAWCPQVKALVTSRETLHLSGERQMAVPP